MPGGSSLWLVPPPTHPLHTTLATLITTTIPALFPIALPPYFSPHVTLSADTISGTSGLSPQEWLDRLELPRRGIEVKVQAPQTEAAFFRKLTLRCEKSGALAELAAACRGAGTGEGEEEVRAWVQGTYGPHLSLMYSDLPSEEVASKLPDVRTVVQEAMDETPDAVKAGGAEIWLVPTHKGIDEWQPVARRKLEGVHWSWET